MRSQIIVVLSASSLILCGCASGVSSVTADGTAAPATVTMQDAKAALMAVRSTWKDPSSIRDSRIGEPYVSDCRGHVGHLMALTLPDACVCIATNAKNSYGAYVGLRAQVALIKGGTVIDMLEPRSQDRCSALMPWPEFDGASEAARPTPPSAVRPR